VRPEKDHPSKKAATGEITASGVADDVLQTKQRIVRLPSH